LLIKTLKTNNVYNSLSIERRPLKDTDFASYLKCLADGFFKLQEQTMRISTELMQELGISEHQFQMACAQHPEATSFLPQMEPLGVFREMDLNELREVIQFQKVYMENHGQ
jgi:hypothetical protein